MTTESMVIRLKSSRPTEHQHRVKSAEREGIRHRDANACAAGDIRHAVEIAGRIRLLEIRGGRNGLCLQGQRGGCELERARSPHAMAEDSLARRYREGSGARAEYLLERLRLGPVVE